MTEDERKYLDFLQSTIGRLAGNSFQLKGWSVALGSVIIGLTAKDGRPYLAWLALIPVAAFWLLDAYYLALERLYRGRYEIAIQGQAEVKPAGIAARPAVYDMRVGAVSAHAWQSAVGAISVAMAHLPIVVMALLVALWGVSPLYDSTHH